MFAAMKKRFVEAKILIKAGADVNVQDVSYYNTCTWSRMIIKYYYIYASLLYISRKMGGQQFFSQPKKQTWLCLNFCVSLVPIWI